MVFFSVCAFPLRMFLIILKTSFTNLQLTEHPIWNSVVFSQRALHATKTQIEKDKILIFCYLKSLRIFCWIFIMVNVGGFIQLCLLLTLHFHSWMHIFRKTHSLTVRYTKTLSSFPPIVSSSCPLYSSLSPIFTFMMWFCRIVLRRRWSSLKVSSTKPFRY